MFKNNLKKSIVSALMLIALTTGIIFTFGSVANAQGNYNFTDNSGLSNTGKTAGFDTANSTSLEGIISIIIYAFLGLVGIIFMVLIIYGGFIWMTAQGSEEKVKHANSIIMGSLFGLIITLAAYVLTYFLFNYLQFMWQ